MKIKKFKDFINEEIKLKDLALGAALGLSSLSPGETKSQIPTQMAQVKGEILSTVSGPIGREPVSNPDLDLVHGVLGSKRLSDDFCSRVSSELLRLNNLGFKTDVSNIRINTYIKSGMIVTESSADIVKSKDANSYTIFETRGSIGSNFEQRHDDQIEGLKERLESTYDGVAKKVKTFVITFDLNGSKISYKQSFFVASRGTKIIEVVGNDLSDLRLKLKSLSKDKSIDLESVKIDMKNFSVTFKEGRTKISNLSLIFDDSGNLNNRLVEIENKNPTLRVIERGFVKNIEWVLVSI